MSSDVWSIISRHDPARWRRTLSHRSKDNLPFDPLRIPTDASLLFDATVYIDQLKGQLPLAIVNLIASRIIFHAVPALAELAVTIGALDPADRRTRSAVEPIVDTLTRISPSRIIVPRGLAGGIGDRGNSVAYPRCFKTGSSAVSKRLPALLACI